MEIVIIIEGIYAIVSVDLQLLSVNDNMSDCYGEGDYLQWDTNIQRCTTKLHSNTFDDKQCLLRIPPSLNILEANGLSRNLF